MRPAIVRTRLAHVLAVAATGLWLAGCSSTGTLNDPVASADAPPLDAASADAPPAADPATTGTVPPLGAPAASEPALYGSDPNDDLSLGKKQYRAGNYGLAEKYFRKAAESHPRDAEVWIGLAASYDRLRRFDLADRAYDQAIRIVGRTIEILNNQGYSYMLRGDYKRAHAALLAAQRLDPDNKYVLNNLRLLAESSRKGKAIQ